MKVVGRVGAVKHGMEHLDQNLGRDSVECGVRVSGPLRLGDPSGEGSIDELERFAKRLGLFLEVLQCRMSIGFMAALAAEGVSKVVSGVQQNNHDSVGSPIVLILFLNSFEDELSGSIDDPFSSWFHVIGDGCIGDGCG